MLKDQRVERLGAKGVDRAEQAVDMTTALLATWDGSRPHKQTLNRRGWVVAAILFPLFSLLLWGFHKVGFYPKPCMHYLMCVSVATPIVLISYTQDWWM